MEEEQKTTEDKKETKEDILNRLVPPHHIKSRIVTEDDINRVIEEVRILYAICFIPISFGSSGAYAMHHSQIDDKDPLNFFVTKEKDIVINPIITEHSNYEVDSKEGCVTFPDRGTTIVKRWHKIEVEYITIMLDTEDSTKFKFSSKINKSLSGKEAFVWTHEIDHGLSKYIYQF